MSENEAVCPRCGGTEIVFYGEYLAYADGTYMNICCGHCMNKGPRAGSWTFNEEEALKSYAENCKTFAIECGCCHISPKVNHYIRKSKFTPEPYTEIACTKCNKRVKIVAVKGVKVQERLIEATKIWNESNRKKAS